MQLSRKGALLGRVIPERCRFWRWKCGVFWGCPPTPHSFGDPPTAPHVCCFCRQMNWWDVVRQVQVDVSIWGAVHLHAIGLVSAGWSKCPGSVARRARDRVNPMRRSSAGWTPARVGSLSVSVGRRHPVTIRKANCLCHYSHNSQGVFYLMLNKGVNKILLL